MSTFATDAQGPALSFCPVSDATAWEEEWAVPGKSMLLFHFTCVRATQWRGVADALCSGGKGTKAHDVSRLLSAGNLTRLGEAVWGAWHRHDTAARLLLNWTGNSRH